MNDLQTIADTMVRRAQRLGYVLPSDIRLELVQRNLPEVQWRDVVSLSGSALRWRQGRYYFREPISPTVQTERDQQRLVKQSIRQLIRQHKKTNAAHERRKQERADFIQTVRVITEDQRQLTVLSRDLSETGIRLIATRTLLGQKVLIEIPRGEGEPPLQFRVRILWTCTVGDGLFENGGSLLETIQPEAKSLQVMAE
jgi:hypothetical protein